MFHPDGIPEIAQVSPVKIANARSGHRPNRPCFIARYRRSPPSDGPYLVRPRLAPRPRRKHRSTNLPAPAEILCRIVRTRARSPPPGISAPRGFRVLAGLQPPAGRSKAEIGARARWI